MLDEEAELEALEAEWRRAEEISAILDGELTAVPGFEAFRQRVLDEGGEETQATEATGGRFPESAPAPIFTAPFRRSSRESPHASRRRLRHPSQE